MSTASERDNSEMKTETIKGNRLETQAKRLVAPVIRTNTLYFGTH